MMRLIHRWACAAALVALALVAGVVPMTSRPGAALAAGTETVACVPPERIELVPVAGDRYYRRTGWASDGPVGYTAAVPDEIVLQGRPIDVSLTVRNGGKTAATWTFPNAQRFDVVVYDDTCAQIWRWSRGRMFAQTLGTLTLAPGGITTYRIRWDQRDQSGRQVRLGLYEVRVVFLGRRATHAGPVVLSPLAFAVR